MIVSHLLQILSQRFGRYMLLFQINHFMQSWLTCFSLSQLLSLILIRSIVDENFAKKVKCFRNSEETFRTLSLKCELNVLYTEPKLCFATLETAEF